MLALGAGTASAQSLGEIARRERERRATLEQHSPVLTNEDFQRRKILEPVRETRVQTVPQETVTAPPPQTVPQPAIEAPVTETHVSLGEYARRLREQRAARQEQQEDVRVAATTPVVPAAPSVVPQVAPAVDSVRVHDTAGRPVSLGEVARQLRHERQTRESASQVAVNQNPVPAQAPSVRTPRLSLGEYARRLQDARKAKRIESVEAAVDGGADVSATVVGVQRGDTLWKLSVFYLGRGDLWTSLWKANPHLGNPNLIHPGQLLRLPDATQLARSTPPRPGQTEVTALSTGISTQFAPTVPGGSHS